MTLDSWYNSKLSLENPYKLTAAANTTMSSTRNYSSEMLYGINQLKEKRDAVSSQIEEELVVANKLEEEIAKLNEHLAKSHATLKLLQETKDACSKSLNDAERVYNKIQESSQNLLNVIKRDSKAIQKNLNQKNVA